MDERPTYIYALCEPSYLPVEGELPSAEVVRYVGKSEKLRKRFTTHLLARTKTHRDNWIRSVQRDGNQPILVVLESTSGDWIARERWWIAHYRTLGASLTNATDGGEGASNPSPETLARRAIAISLALTGKKFTPERSAKMSLIRKGKKPTAAAIAIRTAALNKIFSDPERVKGRNAAIARAYDEKPERREAKRAVFVANWERPGEHERASEERKQRWADPEYKARVRATLNTPENRAKNSQRTAALWQDPEWKARWLASRQASTERKRAAKLAQSIDRTD